MNENRLARGLVNVLIANVINMIFSLLTNFLLPKYLSVDTYAGIKTFQLLCVYIGILHLGYIDGMFLKYGGKNISSISLGDLESNLTTFRVFQVAITIPLVIIGVLIKNYIFVVFSFCIAPLNLAQYFKLFYQSVGEFKKYGRLMNLVTFMTFLVNIILLFFLKSDSLYLYLASYFVIDLLIWIILEYQIKVTVKLNFKLFFFSAKELFVSIKSGILLMVGNFTSTLLSSMDRWFVKILLLTTDFAQYSFAVSVESVLNVAITPITVTMYNYFCKHKDDYHLIKKCKKYISIFATLIVASAFPAKWIVERFIVNYLPSCSVIFYLFSAQIVYIIVKSVYVNLYKAEKRQKDYFIKLLIVILSGFVFNIGFYLIFKNKESFAIGTLFSAILWLALSERDFLYLRGSLTEYFYLFFEVSLLILCGQKFDAIYGFIIYCLCTVVLDCILYKNELHEIVAIINTFLKAKTRNNS